jgi:hypothetical protein
MSLIKWLMQTVPSKKDWDAETIWLRRYQVLLFRIVLPVLACLAGLLVSFVVLHFIFKYW